MKKKTENKNEKQKKTVATTKNGKSTGKTTSKTTKNSTKAVKSKQTSCKNTSSKGKTTKKEEKKTSQRTSTPKKTENKTNKRKTKVEKAEELRLQAVKDFKKMSRIADQWIERNKNCRSRKESKEIDTLYMEKFDDAEKQEHASYSAYYDYVNKNFSREQQIKAMQKSKNFMSKKYTNALVGGRNGQK